MNTTHLNLPSEKLRFWAEKLPHKEVLFQPVDGKFKAFTWSEIYQQAQQVAAALIDLNFEPGTKIAILSKNCAEWLIADFALMLGGYTSIPIYPTANAETIRHILEHSESKAIFVGKLDNFTEQEAGIDSSILRIAFPYPTMDAQHQWQDFLNTEVREISVDVKPDDVMTILYTSGSTGMPKGAVHTFENYVNAGHASGSRMQLTMNDRCLSYLPLSHCTERAYVESTFLSFGCQGYFVESLATFQRDLHEASPTIFGSVPRLWTLFQKGVLENLPQKKLSLLLKIPLVSGLIKKTIKKKLGFQNTRLFISGSAPLSEKILEWYHKIDIPIGEGWGMTETFAMGTFPQLEKPTKIGTISFPSNNCDIEIADDGEILLKSTSNMLGYYKDEDKTRETLHDGFVHTGDLGKIDGDGYISITGRKKDIFKTEKGKYVAPVPIEKKFAENEFIEQMCLMGTTLSQPVLVVNLSSHAQQVGTDLVGESLENSMQTINKTLEKHERVGHILISPRQWAIESDELTPTLKVKRHVIESKYLGRAQEEMSTQIVWL